MRKRLRCFFFGHFDVPAYFLGEVTFAWRCLRCGRERWYER
jgi:hypothetical protein